MRLPLVLPPPGGVHATNTATDRVASARIKRRYTCTNSRACGQMITLWPRPSATISAVKIRAVTLGLDLPAPRVEAAPFEAAGRFLSIATAAFGRVGLEVQTTRVAGAELTHVADLQRWAAETESAARAAGIDYLSLGRLPASAHQVVADQVAPVLAACETVFVSADLIDGRPASVAMAAACARAVKQLATTTPLGFGNLRFAATAHCPPNIPFLPAAYHAGGAPQFSVAVQAADVVVDALSGPGGMADIEDRLVDRLEAAASPVETIGDELAAQYGYAFVGIDLSPAPFPS